MATIPPDGVGVSTRAFISPRAIQSIIFWDCVPTEPHPPAPASRNCPAAHPLRGRRAGGILGGRADDDAETEAKGEPVDAVGELVGAGAPATLRARSAGSEINPGGDF